MANNYMINLINNPLPQYLKILYNIYLKVKDKPLIFHKLLANK